MNYDKKLARLFKDVNNPKNYRKILDLLGNTYLKEYHFKDFNNKDLDYIVEHILDFFSAVKKTEDEKRLISWYNKCYFIVSDKNYVLFETMSLFMALQFYIRGSLMMFFAKLKNCFSFERFIFADNIDKHMYFIKGVNNAARFCNVEWDELDNLKPAGYDKIM